MVAAPSEERPAGIGTVDVNPTPLSSTRPSHLLSLHIRTIIAQLNLFSYLYSYLSRLAFYPLANIIVMAAPDGVGQPGADWDEAQCTAALALLERLQTQVPDSLARAYKSAKLLRSTTCD
jgi:hypothetical protein